MSKRSTAKQEGNGDSIPAAYDIATAVEEAKKAYADRKDVIVTEAVAWMAFGEVRTIRGPAFRFPEKLPDEEGMVGRWVAKSGSYTKPIDEDELSRDLARSGQAGVQIGNAEDRVAPSADGMPPKNKWMGGVFRRCVTVNKGAEDEIWEGSSEASGGNYDSWEPNCRKETLVGTGASAVRDRLLALSQRNKRGDGAMRITPEVHEVRRVILKKCHRVNEVEQLRRIAMLEMRDIAGVLAIGSVSIPGFRESMDWVERIGGISPWRQKQDLPDRLREGAKGFKGGERVRIERAAKAAEEDANAPRVTPMAAEVLNLLFQAKDEALSLIGLADTIGLGAMGATTAVPRFSIDLLEVKALIGAARRKLYEAMRPGRTFEANKGRSSGRKRSVFWDHMIALQNANKRKRTADEVFGALDGKEDPENPSKLMRLKNDELCRFGKEPMTRENFARNLSKAKGAKSRKK